MFCNAYCDAFRFLLLTIPLNSGTGFTGVLGCLTGVDEDEDDDDVTFAGVDEDDDDVTFAGDGDSLT